MAPKSREKPLSEAPPPVNSDTSSSDGEESGDDERETDSSSSSEEEAEEREVNPRPLTPPRPQPSSTSKKNPAAQSVKNAPEPAAAGSVGVSDKKGQTQKAEKAKQQPKTSVSSAGSAGASGRARKSAKEKQPAIQPDGPDDGSESDTDADTPPPKGKPVASAKPTEASLSNSSKPKKEKREKEKATSTPMVIAAPAAPGKRPAASADTGTAKKTKREKVVVEASNGGVAANEEGEKRGLFQRLWSEEDEIFILKGMVDFKAEKGYDPMAEADSFLDVIRGSLDAGDVNKGQLVNKVKRLKKKFLNAKKKKLTNPREIKAFELSKLIWGDENGGETDVEIKGDGGGGKRKEKELDLRSSPRGKNGRKKGKVEEEKENGLVVPEEGKVERRERVKSEKPKKRPTSTCILKGMDQLLDSSFSGDDIVREAYKYMDEESKEECESDMFRAKNVAASGRLVELQATMRRLRKCYDVLKTEDGDD